MLWRAAPALAVLALSTTASAQTTAPPASEPASPARPASSASPSLSAGAGLQALTHWGSHCNTSGDMVSCTKGPLLFGGFQLKSSLRFAKHFGVGVAGSVAWGGDRTETYSSEAGSSSTSHTLYRGSVVALAYPFLDSGLWLGLEGGVAVVRDARSGAGLPSFSDTQTGMLLGAAVGYDFALSKAFTLGLETRALYMAFRNDSDVTDGWSYGRTVWPTIGVNLAYHAEL